MHPPPGEQLPLAHRIPTVGSVLEVCDQQAVNPQDGDPFIRAYAVAAADHIRNHKLGRIVQLALDIRAVDPPRAGNIFNLSRVEVHRQSFQLDQNYPDERYIDPDTYHENIGIITSDKSRRSQLIHALERNRINASIGERYKSHKVLLALLAPRIGEKPRLLDVGSGEFQGLKQLHFSHLVPFEAVHILPSPRHETVEEIRLLKDLVNGILSSRHQGVPGQTVGVEPVRMDKDNEDWFFASSIKPSEFHNEKRINAFHTLRTLKSDNVFPYWHEFTPAGMAHFETADFQNDNPFDKAEVVSFATVLNQLPSEQIEPTRELARKYVTDNGIILYQDRFMPDPRNTARLKFLPDYNNFNYRTLLEFANDPTHRLYDLMQWETGRCQVMRPGPDLQAFLTGELA